MIEIQVATKCADCHLFVDENDSFRDSTPEFPIAEYIHLIRGDCPLEEELDANHEPRPGPTATLDWWRENGPYEMRARFEVARQERERDEERRALVRRMDELPERLTPEQRAEYDDLMRRVRALGGES